MNLYVQLGHGRDYAGSATSAGQDIIDVYAVDLCDPAGGAATKVSMDYVFRGRCEPIEVLRKTNSWVPNAGDQTPPGSETLVAYRTKYGLIEARGTIGGKPRRLHEAARDLHARGRLRARVRRLQQTRSGRRAWTATCRCAPSSASSGAAAARHQRLDADLVLPAPTGDQSAVLHELNNKQAPGWCADAGFTSVYRSMALDHGIKKRINGARRIALEGLVDAMEDAATVDLRGAKVLPWALRAIGKSKADSVARSGAADNMLGYPARKRLRGGALLSSTGHALTAAAPRRQG